MSLRSGNGGSIRRYLLEELSEQEREQLERRLMSDDDLYQKLLLGEDDLIDEYISGTLPEHERAKFSQHFLRVPELRDDVRATAALKRYAIETAPRVFAGDAPDVSLLDRLKKFFMRPAVVIAFATALCAAVALAAWLATQNSRLRRQVEQLQARQTPSPAAGPDLAEQLASERLRNEQLSAELLRQRELLVEESRKLQPGQEQQQPTPARRPATPPSATAFVALTLTSGSVRESGELKKISVPPGARGLRIRLNLPAADYRRYEAVLQTVEGREVFSRRGLRAGSGRFVTLNVPARFFGPDDYRVVLSGVNPSGDSEEISSYYFRVLK